MAMVQPADMAVKANEILARFRPIAPKPALPASPVQAIDGAADRVLCHLQNRPCRARKRGRPSAVPVSAPAAAAKRKRAAYPVPLRCAAAAATDAVVSTATRAYVSVPGSACMPFASLPPATASTGGNLTMLSTTMVAGDDEEEERDVPVERDLLRKLLEPKVISPRAMRPVGSTIHVESIVPGAVDATSTAASKTAEEVEAEVETDALPAVVTDSSNRVRLVNDAYKEMVGAPECLWLGAVAASRRISGEVALVVAEQATLPESPGGFSCTAKIEWECRGGERASFHAACDVSRLQCEYRHYLFAWRFRTADASSSGSSHRAGGDA
ncbi:hypothetical protein CFC21_022698 [Triticum aestivum]|uniref:Seed dormancy protein n=5 Tax=Triticum TaxID=4564 RepID=T1VZ18_WHEAT|nr:uncharacterized protein LOC123044392 [Triticum aestivum]QBZ92972.1 seed dormancy protein [Triticum turgidum]QBZ92973.1 seed dormancy protein [Triticum carthlicum]VAH44307.1 unnamed protein product [Triticum turgidum subsp. durum]AGT95991.1 seed dormancy protein [Triticum aestivum]AGT95992.1 seed dormancy protein [Triticum aestivum]